MTVVRTDNVVERKLNYAMIQNNDKDLKHYTKDLKHKQGKDEV